MSHNEILLELNLDLLERAFKSAFVADELLLKLTKNREGYTYLNIMITRRGGGGGGGSSDQPLQQEVPVRVLPAEDIPSSMPPDLPTADVRLFLPESRILRGVVDRMRAIDPNATISASALGELTLALKTDMVSVRTCFKDLHVPPPPSSANDQRQQLLRPDEFAHVCVDLKLLARFVAVQQAQRNILMALSDSTAVTLFLVDEDSTISFFLPHVAVEL